MICFLQITKDISIDPASKRRWAMAGFSMIKFLSAGTTAVLALNTVAVATELCLSHQRLNKDVRQKVAEISASEMAAVYMNIEIKILGPNCCLS